ncbi:uncharacterized protein [Choristoneura fumiferana]|uniref:uncharacterized protein n=1 Tax=Choristoneura fumiferana TaxID=7141 RepID=UPI003D15AE0C
MNRANSADLICTACSGELTVGEEYLQCMVKNCDKLYHRLCTTQKLTMQEKDTWVCPECCAEHKKGGRNCDTPVGTPLTIKNIASRNKSGDTPPTLPSRPTMESSVMELEVQRMRDQMSLLSQQLASAVSTIAQYQIALSDYVVKFELLHDKFANLELALSSPRPSLVSVASGPDVDEAARSQKSKRKRETKDHEHRQSGRTGVPPALVTMNAPQAEQASHSGDQETGRVVLSDGEECDKVPEEEWREVRNRKKRYSSVRCTAGPEVTPLRAVEYRKYIHLWNMVSGADEILLYLRSLSPEGSFTVDELKSKGDYKSYKIGVPAALLERYLSADCWPVNARIRPWLFRKPGAKGPQS